MGDGRTGGFRVGEGDGKDGVHSCGEVVDGGLPVAFECHKGNTEPFNPSLRSRRTGEEDDALAEFLGEEMCGGHKDLSAIGTVGTDDYELILFQRV